MFKAALFDLDGVLIDSETIYTRIWEDIERVHPTGIDNFPLRIKGTTLPNILATYFPDPEICADVRRMLRVAEDNMVYRIFDGVLPFLDELADAGIPAAIVTSSNHAKMDRLFADLPGFREYFAAVLTDDDTTHSKPHPECYLTAAARLDTPPEHCVVFEDSYAGLQAGRASGAHVVALATTNPHDTLVDRADVVFDHFTDITLSSLRAIFDNI